MILVVQLVLLVCRVRQIKVFFALLPKTKNCGVRSRPESQGDEPATQRDEDDELLHEEGGPERPFFWHRGSRPSVWHSVLGPPRGGGRGGEEDQAASLLRSSSTPAVAFAGLVWLVASRACGCIYSDMLENSCGIVSLLLVLLVMMHLVLCFLRLSMSVTIPQVQFLDQVIQISCRGAVADSHGLLFRRHNYFLVAPQYGDRCPCCTGRAGSHVLDSLLYGVRCSPEEYRTTHFLRVCFRKYLRIQHSLVRQWIHVGFSPRGFCKNFTRFYT